MDPEESHKDFGRKEAGEDKKKESTIKKVWNELWNRSYIPVFIFVTLCLLTNTTNINREKYDGKRIFPETFFNSTFVDEKNSDPCGWITVKYGYHRNRTCSGNTFFHRHSRYGCFLSECGDPKEVLCRNYEDGWISRDVQKCRDSSQIRHFCCRPQTRLCTWQGVWTSVRSLRDVECSFEPDLGCGKLRCNNGEHRIFRDSRNRCQMISINGKLANASCGQLDFADDSDTWYKKIDAYSVFKP